MFEVGILTVHSPAALHEMPPFDQVATAIHFCVLESKISQAAVNWQVDAVFAAVVYSLEFVLSYDKSVFEVPTTASARFRVLVVRSAAVFALQYVLLTKKISNSWTISSYE